MYQRTNMSLQVKAYNKNIKDYDQNKESLFLVLGCNQFIWIGSVIKVFRK